MTFNTRNNVPSTDPRDLYDNAENLDKLVNGADPFYADRKGVLRESWAGMENTFDTSQAGRENAFTLSQADKESRFQAFLVSSGYVSKGDYAANVVLAERNEYVAVDAATTGTSPGLYRPNASATLPLTLTGTWATDSANLVLLGDDVLRQELAGDPAWGGGALLVNGALVAASSRAEMKGYNLAEGAQVSLDEGGRSGIFVIKSGVPPADPSEGVYVVLANGNYAERLRGSVTDVMWFGAKGDGATDDTAAIQAACDISKRVIVPAGGTFVLSDYVSLDSKTHLTIDGNILIKESTSTPGFFPAGFDVYLKDYVTIDGSGTFSCERLIDIPESEWLTTFNTGNLATVGFAPHISIHGSNNCKVSGVSFYKTQGGVYIYRGHLPAAVDWDFQAIVPAIPRPSGNVISGVSARFVVNASHAFREQTNAKLLNSYCYRSGDGGMYMQICTQSLISGNTRTSPYGDKSTDPAPIKTNDMQGISIEFCSDTIVSNNTVIGFLETGIDVKRDCSNILVEGNLVRDCQTMSIASRGGDAIYGVNTGIVLSGNVIQNHGYTHTTYATYVDYPLKGAIHVSASYSAIIRGNTVTGVNSTYGGNPIYAAGVKFSNLGFWDSSSVEARISITNLVIENNTVNFPEFRTNYSLDSTGFEAENCTESGIKVLGLWGKVVVNSNSLLSNILNPEIFSSVLSRAAIEVNANSASEIDSVSEVGIQQCSVCDNIVNGWNAGGIYVNGGNNSYDPSLRLLVSGNSISSLPGYGMLLLQMRGVNVTGNSIFDVGGNVSSVNRRGVMLDGCTYASFTNNTVLKGTSTSYDECVRFNYCSVFSAHNTLQYAAGSPGPAVVAEGGVARTANEGSNVASN